jgi:hypothetical protein
LAKGAVFGGLNGGGGSNIKSIQRGTITTNDNPTTLINISAVDINKSIIVINQRFQSDAINRSKRALFVSPTQINLTQNVSGSSAATIVDWEVIEFNNVKNVQTGTFAMTGASSNVTITSVNLAKSLLYVTQSTDGTGGLVLLASVTLSTATNLSFTRNGSYANTTTISWQVVEFN